MDFDLTNLTQNSTFNPDDIYKNESHIMEVPALLVSLFSVVANIFIITTILKNNVLKTHVNLYVVNWCICNLFLLILAPVSMNIFGITRHITYEALCLWDQFVFTLLSGNLIFVAVLLIDWYIMIFGGQNCFRKCKNSAKLTVTTVWIVMVVVDFVSVAFCVNDLSLPLAALLLFYSYMIVFVIIICTHLLRLIKLRTSSVVVEKDTFVLILVTSYFLCWLLNWVLLCCFVVSGKEEFHEGKLFSYVLGFSNSMIVLYLFYRYDNNFRKCFRELFKRNQSTKV
ncbi:kappa-type opioid receptor [Aethina tumida]|uniref:kappa-type opioid receptor n=1 Tax=Aethina tumida TaxID=116153 RepID=UPI00096B0691|nr:kappa-type opioid receptor [Aethina tumida]